MPMPNNGYKWRPNDNSSTTNLRYSLEAEKWVKAVSDAQYKMRPRSISKDLAFIGLLFELVVSVVLIILLGFLQLLTALIRLVESGIPHKSEYGDNTSLKTKRRVQNEQIPTESSRPKSEKKYPEGWQLIFWTRFGELRAIWKFLFLWVSIFLIEVTGLFILGQFWPGTFRIYRDTLIFAGGVSFFFAFTGMD